MSKLNAVQAAVLLWIAEGRPPGVMTGSSHRVSAAALRNRGFVTTSGKGPTWDAKITKGGRSWLMRTDTPDFGADGCAFCGVTRELGARLVNGPGVGICGDCVHLAAEIFEEETATVDHVGTCVVVLEDGSRHDVAAGVYEVVSRLGRDDSAMVVFDLVDSQRLAVRRQAVRHLHAAPELEATRRELPVWSSDPLGADL